LLKPAAGQVILDGQAIGTYKAKEVARRLGLLPQASIAPDGITVADLVARGRYPYQSLITQWTEIDETAVVRAMNATGVNDLSARLVDELSGGQRQRVWLAMVLAQETPIMLMDEPTTFLDIAHQIEMLELFTDLHRDGRTLVAVLHDLNHAARYGTHMIAMKDGRVVAEGAPSQIVTAELVEEVFGLACVVVPDPVTGTPSVTPCGDLVLVLGQLPVSRELSVAPGCCSCREPQPATHTRSDIHLTTTQFHKDPAAIDRLTPEQFAVTQKSATEPPFRNEFWNNHDDGIYVDIVSGEPLFSSTDKFDSSSGWPSFTRPIEPANVVQKDDRTLWMKRTEVRSANGDSHLGHLFDDGPVRDGGMRYCINSAALRFVPVDELESQGYGDYRSLFTTKEA
jgi:iron complex transport system ATP-binding protein